MSSKYFDKLITGDGTSSKKVASKFGSKILQKFGWEEGKGLGKQENGATECIQIKRREDQVGLGKEEEKKKFDWGDEFWKTNYDSIVQNLSVEVNDERKKKKKSEKSKSISKTETKEERRKR